MISILNSYRLWLKQHSYSPATVRNYLADAKKYLISQNFDGNFSHIFSLTCFSSYLSDLNDDSNYKRFLASLRVFCQFALDQSYITTNPLNHFQKNSQTTNQNELISQFKDYLIAQHFSSSTIKNYLNDIQNYLFWLEQQSHVS